MGTIRSDPSIPSLLGNICLDGNYFKSIGVNELHSNESHQKSTLIQRIQILDCRITEASLPSPLPTTPTQEYRTVSSTTTMTDSEHEKPMTVTEPNAVKWFDFEIAGLSWGLDPNHCGLTVTHPTLSRP